MEKNLFWTSLFNPLFTATLLENKFLRTEDFSEKQFYRFQNMLI